VTAVLLRAEHRWSCPNCDLEDVTYDAGPHSRFHACRGLYGLSVAMVPAGTRCKIIAVEREEYIGAEDVQYAPETGRPVAMAVTVRDDGQDCTVFAPCARGSAREW
jgi:hypothetical protein